MINSQTQPNTSGSSFFGLGAETMAIIVAGGVIGTGLAARSFGLPMMGKDTLGVVALSIAGGMLPIPLGGAVAAAVGGVYLLGLPIEAAVFMAVGGTVGTLAAVMVDVKIIGDKTGPNY